MTRVKHGMSHSGTYNSWHMMKQRCLNPNAPNYVNYGARGIKVCERWMKFANFLEDMGERPHGTTLDRIHNDKDYEPSNCKWSDKTEQNEKKRSTAERHRYWEK